MSLTRIASLALLLAVPVGCAHRAAADGDEHADHAADAAPSSATAGSTGGLSQGTPGIPAGATDAQARLAASPRHGEWVMVKSGPTDSVRAWVVYPERSGKAPVVLVVHEIFGLTSWVRGVADQLAADGFIAIAPDLLTMQLPGYPAGDPPQDSATSKIRTLAPADVHRQLAAVASYGMKLPAALPKYGIVGYCWGGSTSFQHAVMSPSLGTPGFGAAVVYYGGSPRTETLSSIQVPVLGLYGGNDARVNATIPPADSAMKALGKSFTHHVYDGARHGFLRQQNDSTGANLRASREAWPETIAFFRKHLGA